MNRRVFETIQDFSSDSRLIVLLNPYSSCVVIVSVYPLTTSASMRMLIGDDTDPESERILSFSVVFTLVRPLTELTDLYII